MTGSGRLAGRSHANCSVASEAWRIMQPRRRAGRPKILLGDLVIGAVYQAMENDHSRDALSDRPALMASGMFAGAVPSAYNLRRAMLSTDLRDELVKGIHRLSDLVLEKERWFLIDATYMSTPYYRGTMDVVEDDGSVIRKRVKNAKLFLARGLKTGVVIAWTITDGSVNDQTQFEPLLTQIVSHGGTVRGGGVLADAGFNKQDHYETVGRMGGRAFLDFDANAQSTNGKSPYYDKQLALYRDDRDAWCEIYDFRSLCESLNHAIKTPFKDVLNAQTAITRENEALALILAYNLARVPELRSKFRLDLPFADAKAMAFVDGAIQRKRRPPSHPMDHLQDVPCWEDEAS